MTTLDLARSLIDIDSTTGREGEACRWLADHLQTCGFTVTEQPVDGDRFNILAFLDPKPDVVLSTHVDCVPPFFPSRVEGGRLNNVHTTSIEDTLYPDEVDYTTMSF